MAIASGLTCVNYLASNFYLPTYAEGEFRYSPTLAYKNEVLTSYVSRQQQQLNLQQTNVFDAPFLEFTRLSLAETTFDFTTSSSTDNNQQEQQTNSYYNEDFKTEFKKMKNEKIEKGSCYEDNHTHPFSVNNDPCQKGALSKDAAKKGIFTKDTFNTFELLNDEDKELDAIFIKSKSSPRILRSDKTRFKSNSLPLFNNSIEKRKVEEEVSDSEIELSQIITPKTPPRQQRKLSKSCPRNSIGIIGVGSNRKRRTLADSPRHSNTNLKSPSGNEQLLSASLTKRPCIDAEKMHRSIVLRSSRPCLRNVCRNLDKELFVPIDK